MAQNNKKRINALQGLRGIGYLCVLSGHCTITKLGAFGVSIFFIMSGFLLTYKWGGAERKFALPIIGTG